MIRVMTRFFPNGSSTSTAEEVGENHHESRERRSDLCDVKPGLRRFTTGTRWSGIWLVKGSTDDDFPPTKTK